jgi:hypothetical protein
LIFIAYAGVIRGAIAFGLVCRINPVFDQRSVIITSCLAFVIFSAVFMGGTCVTLLRVLYGKPEEEHHAPGVGGLHESFYNMVLHPNLEASVHDPNAPKEKLSCFKRILVKIDEKIKDVVLY